MDHRTEDRQPEQNPEAKLETELETRPDPSRLNAFERLYEHFRPVPLKYLDIFIWVCVIALVAVVAVGVLKAKGIL